jgi:hypothetical protein
MNRNIKYVFIQQDLLKIEVSGSRTLEDSEKNPPILGVAYGALPKRYREDK